MNINNLMIKWNETGTISLFHDKPPSIDEGLNSTINEKIRRFNNSLLSLFENIMNLEQIKNICTNDSSNIYDNLARRYFRNIYLELYIYQEKLLNIVCNLYFVKCGKNRSENISNLSARAKFFNELQVFIDMCKRLKNDERFQLVLGIRDDEVHNLSQIDSFILDLHNNNGNAIIINKGYKLKIEKLYENYNYVLNEFIKIKEYIQEFINSKYMWKIYYTLKNKGEEIWIN